MTDKNTIKDQVTPFDYRMTLPGKVTAICDGQFGSTGKGLLAAYLAMMDCNYVAIATTNAAANAGHTTRFHDGDSFVVNHLPTFGIIQQHALMYLNAGSIIDPNILIKEIEQHNCHDRVKIHPMAAVITAQDKVIEATPEGPEAKIAGTQKGVSSALARKTLRAAPLAYENKKLKPFIEALDLNSACAAGVPISMEVPQGFSLGINSGFYPHVTSRNCTVMQGLADANLHPRYLHKTAMALRTYPIRVGHLTDEGGKVIGHSGPVYPDQDELTWDELGQTPETTTVTGRVRRVFTWSNIQFTEAVWANQPDVLFLNFMNYCRGVESHSLPMSIQIAYKEIMGFPPTMLYGYGPNVEDIDVKIRSDLSDDSRHGESQDGDEQPQRLH